MQGRQVTKQDITSKIGVPDPPTPSSSLSVSLSLPSLSISDPSPVDLGTSSRLFPEMLDILNIPIEFQDAFSACRAKIAV